MSHPLQVAASFVACPSTVVVSLSASVDSSSGSIQAILPTALHNLLYYESHYLNVLYYGKLPMPSCMQTWPRSAAW